MRVITAPATYCRILKLEDPPSSRNVSPFAVAVIAQPHSTHGQMRLAALALPILIAHPVFAFWPFQQKRYESEAFVNAGDLGVASGRVAAVGDWNGDQLYAWS